MHFSSIRFFGFEGVKYRKKSVSRRSGRRHDFPAARSTFLKQPTLISAAVALMLSLAVAGTGFAQVNARTY
jgi:hypothetical protein